MTAPHTVAGHTAGPHVVDGINRATVVSGFNLIWGNGELLAYVARDADAVLYAAATDLLAELIDVVERLAAQNADDAEYLEAALSGPRAAIAKATAARQSNDMEEEGRDNG